MRRRRSRITWLGWLAAVLAFTAATRVVSFMAVLGAGEITPLFDGDSSYHLHRIEATLRHFPFVPHFDPDMNWPKGAFCPWADGFDLLGAAFALLTGGSDPLRQRIAIALWPAVVGVVVVWAAIRLARTVAPAASWRGAALASGLVTALVPEYFRESTFGRIDHHVFEALAFTLLATWALKRFPVRPGAPPPVTLAFEVEGALVSALAVWTFSGSPLYVAIAAVPLGWSAFQRGEVRGSGGAGLVAGGLLAAALSLPAIAAHRHLVSFRLPSLLQPLLLVIAGLGVGACALAGTVRRHAVRRSVGVASALLLGVALVLAMAPGALREVQSGISGWLLHRDAWLSTVGEFKPLIWFDPREGLVYRYAYWAFGWVVFAAPVALVVTVIALRRNPRGLWLGWFVAAAMVLALMQARFGRVATPFLGVAVGLSSTVALRSLALRRRWLLAVPVPAAFLLGAFLLDDPSRSLFILPARGVLEPVLDVALELRDLPPTADMPRGILSNWSYGHQLQVQSGLPVVVNGFGSYLDESVFWSAVEVFQGQQGPFDDYLMANRIGVVVAGAATIGNEVVGADNASTFAKGGLNQPYMASVPLSPLLIAGSAVPTWNVPHLSHLMPRAASRGLVKGLAFPLPYLWSYERVPGATVKGTAPRGGRVVAELRFKEQGRPHTYKAYTDAGADGRWSMRLPFPSGLWRPTLRSEERWTINAGAGAPLEFALPEASVRSGAILDVGRLEGAP